MASAHRPPCLRCRAGLPILGRRACLAASRDDLADRPRRPRLATGQHPLAQCAAAMASPDPDRRHPPAATKPIATPRLLPTQTWSARKNARKRLSPYPASRCSLLQSRFKRDAGCFCLLQFDTTSSFRRASPMSVPASRQGYGASQAKARSVVCFANRQQAAGTKRVHQVEHQRARADTGDTVRSSGLQEKRDLVCPAVYASTAPRHGKECHEEGPPR
jgi:hypothetical protein